VKHWINRACKSTGRRLDLLEQVDLVDLCPALLEQARRRTVLPWLRVPCYLFIGQTAA
jgi:hypothetical protein